MSHTCSGFGSSLAKDVPFAALYWTLLEPLRGAMMSDDARDMLRRMHLGTGAFVEAPPPPPHPAAPVPPTSLEILVVNIGAAGALLFSSGLDSGVHVDTLHVLCDHRVETHPSEWSEQWAFVQRDEYEFRRIDSKGFQSAIGCHFGNLELR